MNRERGERVTLSGQAADPGFAGPAPQPIDPATGMHGDYWVLSPEERAKGFVEPVRRTYVHDRCGVSTTMGSALAETYARDPGFYSGTFCVGCRAHFPVGEGGEFVWQGSTQKVGTRRDG